MIDTASFTSTIIDLAVSGKISERFQASDSVSEIIAELPEVSNKRKKLLEQTFEYGNRNTIPAHWKWIRLGEIASYGDTPTKAFFDDVSGDTWILDLEDIKSGGELIAKTRVHGKRFAGEKTVFRKGQVLYSKLRPYLKKVLVADEDGISTPELIAFDTFGGVIPQYIVYCLLSSFTDRAIDKRSYGIKMPRVDAGFMVNLPIPLPPVSEQQYIVDQVNAAFAQIDTINSLQAQYADNLTVLRSKLIDAAIQGKLTEQLPEDGTAEELYQQIQAEKQALIKAGRIKKDKPLPEITTDEIPFAIPSNWKWVRFAEICSIINGDRGKNYPAKSTLKQEGIPFISALNLNGVSVTQNEHLLCLDAKQYELLGSGKLQKDDIVICIRGSLGKHGRYPFDKGAIASSLVISRLFYSQDIMGDYEMVWLDSSAFPAEIKRYDSGTAQPNLAANSLEKFLIPLPPLAEQKRIVTKLEELLPLCSTLK